MTSSELIEILKQYPPDMYVYIEPMNTRANIYDIDYLITKKATEMDNYLVLKSINLYED